MKTDLWSTKYEFLYGHLEESKYEFVHCLVSTSDDGIYYLDSLLDVAITEAKSPKVKAPKGLMKLLRKGIRNNEGQS